MFDIKEVKSFMDSVHGYIRIPRLFVERIVDTCEFQRLRNIDQTGMKILYPTAKHDRFSHSLGVFHLGSIAVDALLDNFKENSHWKIRSNNTRYVYWAKNKILFLIACLLHDIGHAPFSHSFEQFYEFDSTGLIDKLIDYMSLDPLSEETENETAAIRKAAQHEKMSAYLVLDKNSPWRARIGDLLNDLGYMPYPEPIESSVGEYDKPFPTIDSEELDDDLQFIARMIMGVKYSDYIPERQIRNCFIELLNGSIDVDKLDYIVRDTKMSGISNITLDIERLLGALTIIPTTVYRNYVFDDDTPIFDDTIIRNLETKETESVWISGTLDRELIISEGTVFVPADGTVSLQQRESNAKEYLQYEAARFTSKSGVFIDGKQKPVSQLDDVIDLDASKGANNLELRDAKIVSTAKSKGFTFCVSSISDANSQGEYLFWIKEANVAPVELRTHAVLYNGRFSGRIRGKVTCLEVLCDKLAETETPPTPNCYTGYSLGFNKQAVNLISNVSDARNYLYLWIYSHHKVIYYANYLIIELARLAIPTVHKKEKSLSNYLTESIVTPETSYLLDESDIHAHIRAAYKQIESNNPEYVKLFKEHTSRIYRKSLYKSLAEFDLVFEQYSLPVKMKIRKHLENISMLPSHEDSTVSVHRLKFGYIKTEILSLMKSSSIALHEILEDMIWIESRPSVKKTDLAQIVISFKSKESSKDMIVSMDRLPILNSGTGSIEQNHYFYLYFRTKTQLPEGVGLHEVNGIIKDAFLNYINDALCNKHMIN